MAFWKKR